MDTAEAGKALLARGKLRNRVTLIPLDKVRAARVSGDLMSQVAGSLGPPGLGSAFSSTDLNVNRGHH